MKIADHVLLSGSTAEQKFHFGVPLSDVYSTHHSVQTSFWVGAAPHINALTIAAGGAMEVAIVQGIDNRGSMRMREALGAVDHQL
jgi:adhesin HecA-like repeat protein